MDINYHHYLSIIYLSLIVYYLYLLLSILLQYFSNSCECEAHPLLKTINRELRGLAAGPDCSLPGNYRPRSSLVAAEVSPSPGSGCGGAASLGPGASCGEYRVCHQGRTSTHPCPAGLHWARVGTT